ncbi:hypothetical protein TNCV_4535811 [Trichonephila clavipes]|nr:hypothetical protein TNCV_4535811 [Trichonephila clavipes]
MILLILSREQDKTPSPHCDRGSRLCWSMPQDISGYAPHTSRPVVENVDKITEIIEVDRHVSNRSIAQELKIDHKTVLSHLRKIGFKKAASCLGVTPINTKKHDGSNFHLRNFGQTE